MSKAAEDEVGNVIEVLISEGGLVAFQATNGFDYISLTIDHRVETFAIGTRSTEAELRRFLRRQEIRISSYRLKEVVQELEALAKESGIKRKVDVRVSKCGDCFYVDLNDPARRAVKICDEGYEIVSEMPVHFLRTKKQEPLPEPVAVNRERFLRLFEKWYGQNESQRLLILTYALKCLHHEVGSYPILIIEGPQGSGKSTQCRRIKALIDPSDPWSYSPPEKNDDLIVAAFHSLLLVFDNLSGINHKIADMLCRISTGGGIAKRTLYDNHDEAFYKLHRPTLLNGIDEPTTRSDLLDRAVTLRFSGREDSERTSEDKLDQEFRRDLPQLLAGLFQIFADCLKVLPAIRTNNLPRLSDFSRLGIAMEMVLGMESGTFLKIYQQNRKEQFETSFWNDELCSCISQTLVSQSDLNDEGKLRNTPTNMRNLLFKRGKFKSAMPSVKAFSGWLKRVTPLLESNGITVVIGRKSPQRYIEIFFTDELKRPRPPSNDPDSDDDYLDVL